MTEIILNKLVIIGVGLIGGSFALALRRASLVEHIVGIGRSRENLLRAKELGVIDEIANDLQETLKDADAFVSPAGLPLPFGTGHFNAPYSLLAIAIGIEAEGSTLVLNGGNTLLSSFYYPAITITKACTLKAFPDRPVTIGK